MLVDKILGIQVYPQGDKTTVLLERQFEVPTKLDEGIEKGLAVFLESAIIYKAGNDYFLSLNNNDIPIDRATALILASKTAKE